MEISDVRATRAWHPAGPMTSALPQVRPPRRARTLAAARPSATAPAGRPALGGGVRRPLLAGALALAALGGALAGCGGGSADPHPPTTTAHARAAGRHRAAPSLSVRLRVVSRAALPAPVQLPGFAALPDGELLAAGGLDAADQSVDAVVRAAPAPARRVGALAQAFHDAGGAALGRRMYLFGGGTASGPIDAITAVDPGGATHVAGHLPQAMSDTTAVATGGRIYVIGGYTTTTPLRSVLAFAPGGGAPATVATLPHAVRYAAAAAVGGRILVAGGTDGTTARREIVSVDPATHRTTVIGHLPQPLAHAAGAALGGIFYVLGGRGDGAGSQRRAILAIDPRSGRVRSGGRLPLALSDLSAATTPDGRRIAVAGGRDPGGKVLGELWTLARAPATAGGHAAARARAAFAPLRPGAIPPPLDPGDVYAAERPGLLAQAAVAARPLVYVPNSVASTVDVIDQRTGRIVGHFATGKLPQHVTPSWDLDTLWVTNDLGNSLTPVDPHTGEPGRPVPVLDPYNLYFTADGMRAIVVAEAHAELDFREPHTMRLRRALHVPQCRGVDHMDFTASGRTALVSCEFAARMIVVDLVHERALKSIDLPAGSKPQDVKLSPDGRVFYVADMTANGVWLFDAHRMRRIGFAATGRGAHGLYPNRDARTLYVTNRDEGSISLISFRTRRPYAKWRIPNGSPDMGGLSASGRVLWLSGRYRSEVYAISTRTGRLLHRIAVGAGPHGLAVWPQPGRYSIGHTGILR
jgi:DNA-binding beta-propeller fold protein YncE